MRCAHRRGGQAAARPHHGERHLPEVDVPAPPIPPTVQPKNVNLPSFVTANGRLLRTMVAQLYRAGRLPGQTKR